VPVKEKLTAIAIRRGMIQLDLVASTGQGLLRAYQLTGNSRWREVAEHWGDLPGRALPPGPRADPWPRYANPETVPWKDNKQTGGVTMILGSSTTSSARATRPTESSPPATPGAATSAKSSCPPGRHDTWGRYFWDWDNPVQNCLTTRMPCAT